LTLRNLEIFVAVCDVMNMTTAADKLFISQSAISQTISELERHYGVRLFERLSRKLYLTDAGEKLYGYAQHILGMNTDLELAMKTLGEAGSVRLGASVTIATYVLPSLITTFKRSSPALTFTVSGDNTEEIEKKLLADKVDLGLVEGELTAPSLVSTFFSDDDLTLICGTAHRFAALSAVEPRELAGEAFIVREPGSGTRRTFEDVMATHQLPWSALWECNSTDTIKEAVRAGLGIAVLPKIAVQRELRSKTLHALPIKGMDFHRTFKIAYHKNKYLTPALTEFIRFCTDAGSASN